MDASDTELLDVLESEPQALGTLYDRHASLVYGLALKILRAPEPAQDLTQEVFLTLYQQSNRYDASRGSLAAFLITMTRTRAIDRLRRQTTSVRLLKDWQQSDPAEMTAPEPFKDISAKECAERVRKALATLPANESRALEMSYFQGLTQAEIAAQLETPIGTVKSWCRRGLLGLKDALSDLVE